MKQVYLNSAASAFPLAPGVTEAMLRCMQNPPQISGRDTLGVSDEMHSCRWSLAQLMDAAPEQIALTHSATYGLNLAILGMSLKPGDLVVTSVMEHNSVLRPLARLENLLPIRVAHVPLDSQMRLDSDAYDKLMKEEPRLVVLNHASNVTGRINPVASLFAKAKAAGAVTFLDASQTMGLIPVRPGELNADMMAFSGHKGLKGPLGTGALYVAPHISLEPVFVGGTGVKSDLQHQPREMPMRLEAGTPNVSAFAGLNAAVVYHLKHAGQTDSFRDSITTELYRGLAAIEQIQVFDGNDGERLPSISFAAKGMSIEQAGFALSESFGIQCRTGLHCAPLIHKYLGSLPEGTIRFSASSSNTMEDIQYAIDAVRRLTI